MALLESELNIPHPGYNSDGELHAYYTRYYRFTEIDRKNKKWENIDDSPDESRASLVRRVRPFIDSLPKDSRVLDLGAGRQIFEREYEDKYPKPKCQIVTMDIARIPQKLLLAQDNPHIQASGREMPFPEEQFDAVISNMAFDFMLPEALPELQRVAKSGASIFLNLHHPSLLKYDINRERTRLARKMRYESLSRKTDNEKLQLKKAVLLYHSHLRDNRLLFETHDQIARSFSEGGFDIKSIEIKTDLRDKWWEVDLVKPPTNTNGSLPLTGSIFDSKMRTHIK